MTDKKRCGGKAEPGHCGGRPSASNQMKIP